MAYDMFKHWLRPNPNPERAMCTVCDIVLNAGKSELEKHAAAKKHQRKMLQCSQLSDLSFSECNEPGTVLIDGQDIDEPIGASSSYVKHGVYCSLDIVIFTMNLNFQRFVFK